MSLDRAWFPGVWRAYFSAVLVVSVGCLSDEFTIGDAGGDTGLDATREDGGADASRLDAANVEVGATDVRTPDVRIDTNRPDAPTAICNERPLPCLPADTERLVEVTAYEQIENAVAGDILQLRDLNLGRTRLPPYTTLRGCEGAELRGALTFDGSRGIVEGFIVLGTIVANQTGEYVVRDNEFRSTETGGALQANANDGILGHQVTMTVERNRFTGGTIGVAANTRYDNMMRSVDIQVRNNIFEDVEAPIRLSESGLTGAIDALVEFNTFVGFERAVDLFGVDSLPTVRANIFAEGNVGIRSNAPYSAPFNMGWELTEPTTTRPINGEVTVIPAAFATDGDYHLDSASLAVDGAGPTAPPDDFQGCLRPMGASADVGARESY